MYSQKLFYFVTYVWTKYVRVFVSDGTFQPNKMFLRKALLALPANITVGLNGPDKDKRSSIFGPFESYEEKSFVNVAPRSKGIF